MNFNYMDTFVNENENHDFEESRSAVRGLGTYNSNGYSATINPLYRAEDVELRSIEDNKGKRFEVLIENEVYQCFPFDAEKKAKSYFCDFTGLTPKKMEKFKIKEEEKAA